MRSLTITIWLLLLALGSVAAQDTADQPQADTTRVDSVVVDTNVTDSSLIQNPTPDSGAVPVPEVDSLGLKTIEDSILYVYPSVDLDTLNDRQRQLVEFETRFAFRQREVTVVKATPVISFQDSLTSWLVTDRWNLRDEIDRSFYHDAGDYFKFNTAHFDLDYQITPMRHTVKPYGLSGDRLAFLIGERNIDPFEHALEPDGLTDLNDIPTALDDIVAILPGPVGLVLGADHAVATLLTKPAEPESTTPESEMMVDKGSLAYANTRGRYSKNFANGREIDLSIGYRNADGLDFGRGDDAYHYTGDVLWPIDVTKSIHASGWLYDRTGRIDFRPGVGGNNPERNRFDRYGRVSLVLQNEEQTIKYEAGYMHQRQSSTYDGLYMARYNLTRNDMFLIREWLWAGGMARFEIDAGYDEYDDWFNTRTRGRGQASLGFAKRAGATVYALNLRGTYVDDFRFLPLASAVLARNTDRLYWMISASYSERAPSLHELHLRHQEANIYGSGIDYGNVGNSDLKSERQVIGAGQVEFGSPRTNVGVAVTGGKIFDGIDWLRQLDGIQTEFSPENGDVDFINVTADTRVGIADFLRFHSGGSYHYVYYENFDKRAYSPNYQTFGGLELHLYWKAKRIDFWGYGEIVYTGPYDGYAQTSLGQEPVVNIKLSAKMGAFRFHWISQNVLSNPYYSRDYLLNPGRFNYYGFTWFFLD